MQKQYVLYPTITVKTLEGNLVISISIFFFLNNFKLGNTLNIPDDKLVAFAIYHGNTIEIRFNKITLENRRHLKVRLNGKEKNIAWFFKEKYFVKLEKYLQQENYFLVKTMDPLEALFYYMKLLKI